MATYVYPSFPAIDPITNSPVYNVEGQIFAVSDTTFSNPLPIRDLNDVPMATVSVGPQAITEPFRVDDNPEVVFKSGPYVLSLWSPRSIIANSELVLAAARSAADSAAASAAAAQLAAQSSGGGGGGGLDQEALNMLFGGNVQDLILRLPVPRLRISATEWEPRPACRIAWAIGTEPAPADQGPFDVFTKVVA
jgi:hypothetical protein